MKIGILGGSFNPVHLGHIYIAQMAIKKLALNQVWMIPTAQNPLKEKSRMPYEARLAACYEITKNNPKIFVKDFEKDSFFAYDLVKKLRMKYPHARFVWVMGGDNLQEFYKWKKVKLLIKLIDFAIFSRGNKLNGGNRLRDIGKRVFAESFVNKKTKFQIFKTKNYDISSTAIRDNRR